MRPFASLLERTLKNQGIVGTSIEEKRALRPISGLFGYESPEHATPRERPVSKVILHVPWIDSVQTKKDNRQLDAVTKISDEEGNPLSPEEKLLRFVKEHAGKLRTPTTDALGIKVEIRHAEGGVQAEITTH